MSSLQRYKRALITHWQLKHPNVVEMIGLIRMPATPPYDDKIPRYSLCTVLPRLPGALSKHLFFLNGTEEDWLPLAHLVCLK